MCVGPVALASAVGSAAGRVWPSPPKNVLDQWEQKFGEGGTHAKFPAALWAALLQAGGVLLGAWRAERGGQGGAPGRGVEDGEGGVHLT